MKVFVPITAKTVEEAIADIKEVKSSIADGLELRLDYLSKIDLATLLYECGRFPVIVTNRHRDEGGYFQGREEERISYLSRAAELGATYVDIEYRHRLPFDKKKSKLIISYHNFQETPANLREIYKKIVKAKPDIVKIVTRANTEDDSKRMIRLIERARKPIIGICMGELGVSTRKHEWNYLTFAALNEEKRSAPGQLTLEEMLHSNN